MREERYEGIAIIGMAGRFPGAESIEEFWANLIAGKESISFFDDAELAESGLDPAVLRRRGHYVPARGILKDAECFDAAFFGVHPKEAEVTDPQQRIFLETCWAALERAGYPPSQMPYAVGVFGGATYNTYFQHALNPRPDLVDLVGSDLVMLGNEKDYLTTRVAYKLGLKGPALNVSTACSTSLVAVAQACQALLTYQCDVALAGGVSIKVPQKSGYYHDEGNIGSADGHTRTFDIQATGTAFSNGVAVVVLKRLEEAVTDGDQIYAVIKGAALNNDGSNRVSFGAPGIEGQSEVVAMAHALAGIDPGTITCVEAHGTATPLGDPIEVAALTKAFRMGTQAKQFCALGSVKSNIGHLDAAAGVTGLIKMALALHHGVIPANLHFTKPNPKLDLENSPFYVNAQLQKWVTPPGVPKRAGVSSFGTGGTNAHLVLEEAPDTGSSGASRPWQLMSLSAKTREALERATSNLSSYLKHGFPPGDDEQKSRYLADAAFTLSIGRSPFVHRRVMVCRDPEEGASVLDALDPKRVFTQQQSLCDPPMVFMFPGQGAQYAGMGAELYRVEPSFRAEVDHCADVLSPILHADLRKVMFPASGAEKESEALLVQTRFTQPALFVIEYALARLWMSWGIKPAAMIGHSVGEYVAGCLAGVFSLEDALMLVARRGALVQAQPSGAMLAIRLPEKDVLPLLGADMAIAAINSPNLCVASGPHESIAVLERDLEAKGVKVRHLHTSHAFHSPMMDAVLEPFTAVLGQVKLGAPNIPYVSNVTAGWITPQDAQSPVYWAGHVRQTVRFAEGIGELLKDSRHVLLEVGPGQTLCTLSRQHPDKQADQYIFASLPYAGDQEVRGVMETLGRLWITGVTVDWQAYYAAEHRRHAVLPTYPFERKRYWPETPVRGSGIRPSVVATATTGTATQEPQQSIASSSGEMAVARKERLLTSVRRLMQDLSGYDLSSVAPSTDLLELGLDSLLLTQAAQLIQRTFGIPVSFRQLMEDLSSLGAIAAHIDEALPSDAEPAQQIPSVSIGSPATTMSTPAQSMLEQILQQQQQLTNQVLQLMGRQPVALQGLPQLSTASAQTVSQPALNPAQKSHGPFKPFDRHVSTALSDQQKQSLEAIIARYVRRTGGSKKLAAENRSILADPRSAAGFNRLWKEMVYPIVTTRSEGARVWDIDGNEYIDFVMGFGASLFGHRPPFVVKAIHEQLDVGFEIGPIQPLVYEVASLMKEFTGMSRFAFTNTGSEAVLGATRLARTVSGRDKIAVFAGAYHGIFDEVLFRPLTVNGEMRTAAIAPGIPESALAQVIVLEYGNPQSLDILRARGHEIAAVLVEPVQSRRLDLQPKEFLHELRDITKQTGTALIFDEVVTGFRVHPGGAQAYFDVRADLATYGKVIGGGVSIGVVAGDAKYMDALDGGRWQYGDTSFPEVGVTFFAGTFVRHPLALSAAKAVLMHLKTSGPDLQRQLSERTTKLADKLRSVFKEFEAPYHITQFSSLIQLSYPPEQKLAGVLYYLLRERGIHSWENRAFIITTAHTDQDLSRLVEVFRDSLSELRSVGLLSLSAASAGKLSGGNEPRAVVVTGQQAAVGVAIARSLDEFPLTEAQKEIWLAAQMGGEAKLAYNEVLKLQFHGPFDRELFLKALHQVCKRHPVLLADLSEDGEWGRMHPDRDIEIQFMDLSGQDTGQQVQTLAALDDDEAHKPFELVSGPLVRATLVKLVNDHHVFFWTAHHIVCDGWSCGVIVDELSKIYSAHKRGSTPALDPPTAFLEYAQIAEKSTRSPEEVIEYWKRQFTVLPPLLDLPIDHPRPVVRSAKAATTTRKFDSAMAHALKQSARQQRTTMVVLLMAAIKTLLYRLTGQSDLVIGLPVAGQAVTDNRCLVGHCVNLLPIRTQLRPEGSFQQNLASVKNSVLDGYDHHQSTIGTILRHLRVPRSANRPPLIEIMFNVDRDPGVVQFEGLSFACERGPKKALHYDLFFNFVEGPMGLALECDYNTDLFEAATVERWIDRFEVLLKAIVENPSNSLENLELLPEAEKRELIALGRSPQGKLPYPTVTEWIENQVAKTPGSQAISFGSSHVTYKELDRRANQLAGYLNSLGVGSETLVGVLVDRSIEMVVTLLGIMKAGGAYVPLDPSFPADRLAYMIKDSNMEVLVTHRNFEQLLSIQPSKVVRLDRDWEDIENQSPEGLPRPAAESLAYVLYTSGSTGKPKGVEITQLALVNFLSSMQRTPGLKETDIVLAVTTLSFDIAGLELYLPLVSGSTLVIASREEAQDPVKLMNRMNEAGCTMMQATPATWRGLVNAGWNGSSMLKILCGGESLPRDLAEDLLGRCAELWNMYGPTETTIWSTVHRVLSTDGSIPIGRPIANTQVYVLDAQRRLAPRGVIAELYIGGCGLARGYLGRPDLTQERFVASPFEPETRLYRTGDLGRWLADGTLECLGRMDTQVKVRGYRIELGEVEAILGRHEGVRQCVASTYEETPGDRVLVGYFEPRANATPLLEELRAHLKKELPDYMIPSIFVKIEALPLTPNGKIDRKALPPPHGQRVIGKAFVAPTDPMGQSIANVWSKILNVERVGLYDNFFELGGHSLAAVRMLVEVRKLTGKTLPLATLFQAPTIAALSEIIRKEGWTPSWSSLVPIKPHGAKPPVFLVHGAEGNVLLYRQLSQHLDEGHPIYGLQSNGLDGKGTPDRTIEQMAARYVKEIMALRPHGPYILGGYCMGGTVALEMAQQLTAIGQKVSLVILLETYNPAMVSRLKGLVLAPVHFLQNIWFHCANLMVLRPKDRIQFLAEKASVEKARARLRLQSLGHLSSQQRHTIYPHLQVKRLNDRAQSDYIPRTYPGRVAIISAKGCFAGEADPSLGWAGLFGDGVEVHRLPIYPRGMLVEPFCHFLAEVLNRCLAD